MKLNMQKELTPVLYDSSGIKVIHFDHWYADTLLCNHWHERIEFILVTSGKINYRLNDYEITLKRNQLAIIPPYAHHYAMIAEDGTTAHTLMFDVETFYNRLSISKRMFQPLLERSVLFNPYTEQPEVIDMLKSIVLSETADEFSLLARTGKIYEFIALLYRYCQKDSHPPIEPHNHLEEVLTYIDEHFCEDISSADLSARFGYSESYFCRCFKSVTGFSPMIYIRILRLEKARELLHKQTISHREIAQQCGFTNANYFTRCFKSYYKMTPSEYIRQYIL